MTTNPWQVGDTLAYNGAAIVTRVAPFDATNDRRNVVTATRSNGQAFTFHYRNIPFDVYENRRHAFVKLALGVVAWPCVQDDTDWPASAYVAPVEAQTPIVIKEAA